MTASWCTVVTMVMIATLASVAIASSSLPSISVVETALLSPPGHSIINANPITNTVTNISHVIDNGGRLKWAGPSPVYSYPTTYDTKRHLQYFVGYSNIDGSYWLVRYDPVTRVLLPNTTELMSDDCVHHAHIVAIAYDATTGLVYAVNLHPDEIQVGILDIDVGIFTEFATLPGVPGVAKPPTATTNVLSICYDAINHLLYIPTHRNLKQLTSRGQTFIVNTLTWGVREGAITGHARAASCSYDSALQRVFTTIEVDEHGPGPQVGELMKDGSVIIMNNGSTYALYNIEPPAVISYSSISHTLVMLLLNFFTSLPTLLYYDTTMPTAPVVHNITINATSSGIWSPNGIFMDPPGL